MKYPKACATLNIAFMAAMKRIFAFALLLGLSFACTMTANAQIFRGPDSARQADKASKKQQKAWQKSAKKQQKALKKQEKAQRKAAKRAQRRA